MVDVIIKNFPILYNIKEINSMLPLVCSVIDHRSRPNVVRTVTLTNSATASCGTFLFISHFDVICDLLLNKRAATWNLFVKLTRKSTFALSTASIEKKRYNEYNEKILDLLRGKL